MIPGMRRGRLWQGVAVLVALGAVAVLTGDATRWGLAVRAWLALPAFAAAVTAAALAGRHVVPAARLGTVALTPALGAVALATPPPGV